jgi:hypothetical protein
MYIIKNNNSYHVAFYKWVARIVSLLERCNLNASDYYNRRVTK